MIHRKRSKKTSSYIYLDGSVRRRFACWSCSTCCRAAHCDRPATCDCKLSARRARCRRAGCVSSVSSVTKGRSGGKISWSSKSSNEVCGRKPRREDRSAGHVSNKAAFRFSVSSSDFSCRSPDSELLCVRNDGLAMRMSGTSAFSPDLAGALASPLSRSTYLSADVRYWLAAVLI